ncbi:MAG: adenine deaminase, partial [Rhizobiales bacterium]|nr:adenine deaminase [Hyphomicrobiales bacterium]
KLTAWSMGSLHGATRFAMDGEIGGLGGGRRADLVLLDDDLKPQSTWYGGVQVVKDRAITPALDAALSARYRYPDAAYRTVKLPSAVPLVPQMPERPVYMNVIRTVPHNIVVFHDRIAIEPAADWETICAAHGLTFVTVVERHGKSNGNVAHGFLKDFALKRGAVASSVGHDSHNIIVAGTNEADMRVALEAVAAMQGGVVVVADGAVRASVPLPIAGLLSDKRIGEVADELKTLKAAWDEAGCAIPYMGFNLIPLSVIPEIRITDKGLVLVPDMRIVPLFEPSNALPG